MRKIENSDDWYAGYRRDAQIALTEIAKHYEQHTIESICDIYSLPSHNHQTFFCKIASENGFIKLFYAKAIQNSIWFSEPIYMYRFEEAKNFIDHPIRHGRIICGKKIIQQGIADRITEIFRQLSSDQPDDLVTPTVDADLTVLTLRDNGKVIREIAYTDAEKLVFQSEDTDSGNAEFLRDLHLKIEEIIGVGIS